MALSRAARIVEALSRAQSGQWEDPSRMLQLLKWFSLTISFSLREVLTSRNKCLLSFFYMQIREEQKRIKRKYVHNDIDHLEGHVCHF